MFIDFGKPFPNEEGGNEHHQPISRPNSNLVPARVTDGSRLAESKYSKIHARGKSLISIPKTELICVIT